MPSLVARLPAHSGAAARRPREGRPLTRLSAAELRKYKRRHPQLFPGEALTPSPPPGAALPRSESNGYVSEAAFQADAVERLTLLGWEVQEGPKGSAGGGAIWYTDGWPDLTIYGQDDQRRMWFAELKQPGNKPSDNQLACHARLRAAGFRVVVVWTLDDLLTIAAEEAPTPRPQETP